MSFVEFKQHKVGNHPTGLLLKGEEFGVLESGVGSVSVYDLLSGRLRRRVLLRDGLNPEMGNSAVGGTLLGGADTHAYGWTVTFQGIVYLLDLFDQGSVLGRARLGPYSLCDWVYAPAAQKLVVTMYDNPAIHFLSSDLS